MKDANGTTKPRTWRVRLLTAVVLMFVAGFLIQANLRCKDPEPAEFMCLTNQYSERINAKPFTKGWPFPATRAQIKYGNRLHIPLDDRRKEILEVGQWEWIGKGVVEDAAVAVLILVAVAILMEMLHAPPGLPSHWLALRRRRKRQGSIAKEIVRSGDEIGDISTHRLPQ